MTSLVFAVVMTCLVKGIGAENRIGFRRATSRADMFHKRNEASQIHHMGGRLRSKAISSLPNLASKPLVKTIPKAGGQKFGGRVLKGPLHFRKGRLHSRTTSLVPALVNAPVNRHASLDKQEGLVAKIIDFTRSMTAAEEGRADCADQVTKERYDVEWHNMPDFCQNSWELLGWDEQTWTNGEKPLSDTTPWDELDHAQMLAAKYLGYNATCWRFSAPDESSPDESEEAECVEFVDLLWHNITWSTMPRHTKKNWKDLGWNKCSWQEQCNFPSLFSGRYWNDLTDGEKLAAKSVGYDEHCWNGA